MRVYESDSDVAQEAMARQSEQVWEPLSETCLVTSKYSSEVKGDRK